MDIKEKFGKYLSRDAQDAIKDSEDLEEAVQAVFYLVAAGKGDKPLKPHLIKAVEFMMQYFEWFSGENNQTLTCSQNSEKPFSCSKCEKKFALEEEAGKCCDDHESADITAKETEHKDGEEKSFFDMLDDEQSEDQSKGKSTPSQQPKNVAPREGTSSDLQVKEKPFKCQTCGVFMGADETYDHKCEELTCPHPKCDKKFKKQAILKKHEKTHKSGEPYSCTECGKNFTIEKTTFKGKPSRCPECYKKFKSADPANRPICEFYKAGHCKYGPKGQNKEGKCYHRHPEPCQKFASGKCTDKKCSLMHTAPVCTFFKKNACGRKFCKFSHPKPPPKTASDEEQKTEKKKPKKPENSEENGKQRKLKEDKTPSNAHIVEINSKIDSFLEQVTKRINQMESRIEANGTINNNRMNYQAAAFPQLMMQTQPPMQPMQQRF